MAVQRDDDEERAARIERILEELRVNAEDVREIGREAATRAGEARRSSRNTVAVGRARRASRKAAKKR